MSIKLLDKFKKFLPKKLTAYSLKTKLDVTERNRFIIIFLSLLFILDYLLFCYISDKNPIKLFPSIPLLNKKKQINIYLPDTDGINILKETRYISIPEDKEGYTMLLIQKILKGSNIENTSIAVPIDIFVRKIWFYNEVCVIDFISSTLNDQKTVIPGTEKIFIESLEKTITENIPSVKKIVLLDRGIPGRKLWEF